MSPEVYTRRNTQKGRSKWLQTSYSYVIEYFTYLIRRGVPTYSLHSFHSNPNVIHEWSLIIWLTASSINRSVLKLPRVTWAKNKVRSFLGWSFWLSSLFFEMSKKHATLALIFIACFFWGESILSLAASVLVAMAIAKKRGPFSMVISEGRLK